jgi:hypothetical protein
VKTFALATAFLLASTAAFAQPTPPECKALPNGGKLTVTVPTVTAPPACQVCTGPGIPSNPVFGFSDGTHNTCELKSPTGGNTGVCKKDSQCPPGTARVTRNNVVVCENGGGTRVIECPAPPRAPDRPRQPPACVQQMQRWAAELKTTEQALRTAVAGDIKYKGTAAVVGPLKGAEAVVLLFAGIGHAWVQGIPLMMRADAACGDGVEQNPTLMAECNRARADSKAAISKNDQIYESYTVAMKESVRNLEIVGSIGELKDNAKKAAADMRQGLEDTKRHIDACIAEIKRGGTRP